jgi:septal ring factor EnvC (AmiA/AmiB activator)
MSQTDNETTADGQQETMEEQLNRVDENVTGLFAKVSELQDRLDELEAENAVLRQQLADGGEDS